MFLVSGWHTCESLEASVTLVRGPPPIVLTGAASCEVRTVRSVRPGPVMESMETVTGHQAHHHGQWSPQGQEWVTEHSTVSCVSFSFEDINTSRGSLWLCWLCVADDGDAVFIIPLSVYFYSHSPQCYWLQLVIMVVSSSYTSSDNVSLSGKISNASTPGDLRLTVRTNLRLTRGDHYLWATLVLVVHQALNWAQWMKLIMQDWN